MLAIVILITTISHTTIREIAVLLAFQRLTPVVVVTVLLAAILAVNLDE